MKSPFSSPHSSQVSEYSFTPERHFKSGHCIAAGPRLFDQYAYVAVINNGMRGPFMPAGPATAAAHWAQPFLALLSDEVKLVGPYISCERSVHVQGPFQITDRHAKFLLSESRALQYLALLTSFSRQNSAGNINLLVSKNFDHFSIFCYLSQKLWTLYLQC